MDCCGRLSLASLLQLGNKQRKPASYERLDVSNARNVDLLGSVVGKLARLGSVRIKQRSDQKAFVMKKMKRVYKQGLAMARQSAPHFADLFRGNHFLLLPLAAASPKNSGKSYCIQRHQSSASCTRTCCAIRQSV